MHFLHSNLFPRLAVRVAAFFLLPLVLGGCMSVAEMGETAEEQDVVTIRVMSYNIQHGRGMDGQVDIRRIAEVIVREEPDIVALQEVDRGVERSGGVDIPGKLAELTGMNVFFDRNIEFQGGDYGNAVLTRFPVLKESNSHLRMIREGEQRGVIHMVLEIGGRELVFMNTHIDYRRDDSERLKNIRQFREIVETYEGLPVIISGDFNDFPGSRTHGKMKEDFIDTWEAVGEGDGFTFRSDNPDRRIDYIFLEKGKGLVPKEAWIPETQASDHLPLVADIVFEQS